MLLSNMLRRWIRTAPTPRIRKRGASLSIEGLETRTVPSVTLPTPGTPGEVTVLGTNAADQFLVRLSADDPTQLEIRDSLNGTPTFVPLADVTSVRVQGLSGHDVLLVDQSNGLVAKEGGLAIRFEGGVGFDGLVIRGDAGEGVTETFQRGPTPQEGSLTATQGTAAATFAWDSIGELRDVARADEFTVVGNDAGGDQFKVVDGPGGRDIHALQIVSMNHDDGAEDMLDDSTTGVDDGTGSDDGTADQGSGDTTGTGADDGTADQGGNNNDDTGADDHGGNGEQHGGRGGRGRAPVIQTLSSSTNQTQDPSTTDTRRHGRPEDDNHIGPEERPGRPPAPGREIVLPLTIANKTTVSIETGGGDDYVFLRVRGAAAGLENLNIDGGEGQDSLIVRSAPSGVNLTTTGFESDTTSTDATYVAELYERQLGRAAATGELQFWQRVLAASGSQSVVEGIEKSAEGQQRRVREFYQQFLNRDTHDGEEMYWVNLLLQGQTEEQVIAAILQSPEFQAIAAITQDGTTTDEQFIQALYTEVLNRDASTPEVSYWLNVLPTVGRSGVTAAFLASQEYRGNSVRDFYQQFLGRTADDSGLNYWVGSGLRLREIRDGFFASAEFSGRA